VAGSSKAVVLSEVLEMGKKERVSRRVDLPCPRKHHLVDRSRRRCKIKYPLPNPPLEGEGRVGVEE